MCDLYLHLFLLLSFDGQMPNLNAASVFILGRSRIWKPSHPSQSNTARKLPFQATCAFLVSP